MLSAAPAFDKPRMPSLEAPRAGRRRRICMFVTNGVSIDTRVIKEAASLVARRICESVANDGRGPKLSVSFGVAVYPQNGDTIERLLSQADSALYSMKQQRIVAAESGQTVAGQ